MKKCLSLLFTSLLLASIPLAAMEYDSSILESSRQKWKINNNTIFYMMVRIKSGAKEVLLDIPTACPDLTKKLFPNDQGNPESTVGYVCLEPGQSVSVDLDTLEFPLKMRIAQAGGVFPPFDTQKQSMLSDNDYRQWQWERYHHEDVSKLKIQRYKELWAKLIESPEEKDVAYQEFPLNLISRYEIQNQSKYSFTKQ